MLGVGDTKCGICKPKLGIYKPYWAVRRIGRNFAASIWASARIDCEVDASFYEVGLHGWWRGINFAASMSAGRILKSPIVKRVREEKDFGTMNRKDFCGLMSFRVEFCCRCHRDRSLTSWLIILTVLQFYSFRKGKIGFARTVPVSWITPIHTKRYNITI